MHSCPVCNYPKLQEPPRAPSGGGSYEICPSCGFQFGVDDDDKGISYEAARVAWLAKDRKWYSKSRKQPEDWPPVESKSQGPKKKSVSKKTTPSVKKAAKKAKPDSKPGKK